jgi:hypothetical protein
VALPDDLGRIAALATAHAAEGETVVGALACEPAAGARVYLCALGTAAGVNGWVALDADGGPVTDRALVLDAVAIAALCELAGDAAFPGDLDELRAQLVQLRITERPDGIDEAEATARDLQHLLGVPPTLATPARLDALGVAARRLEVALSEPTAVSPFTAAMQGAQSAVDELFREVEAAYRLPLD